ncbi:MAG: RNA-binding S4 domain-containing protein [Crocinitomicaceae bacterium]
MTELEFKLKTDQPYIELNKVLQILKVSQTGGHAKILIQNEEVFVNGQLETRVRKKLVKGDRIEIDEKIISIQG